MRFLNKPELELAYDDVFMVPNYSDINSRFDVDLRTTDETGATIPIVVTNMTAIAGKRMAEAVTRRGGLVVLPQDLGWDVLERTISYLKSRHPIFETPVTLRADESIQTALTLIHKRAHGAVIVVDESSNAPIGIFTEADSHGQDLFAPLASVMSTDLLTFTDKDDLRTMYQTLLEKRLSIAPVSSSDGHLLGVVTPKSIVRSDIYKPALNDRGEFIVAAAIGINGDVAGRSRRLLDLGADILVIDTAHGHQQKMLEAITTVRETVGQEIKIVAGNVVSAAGTEALISAGADIVKVGVGPGAMCTTRMMTGVGRPQFSAVLECAAAAQKLGRSVWADGGIRNPRDVALALAAGASNVMFGSILSGTYESPGDIRKDESGRMYKENFGMASSRAVANRNLADEAFDRAKKGLFEEGISHSKVYINPTRPGVEDLIDKMIAGVRSACTYAGARTIDEFQDKVVIGVQTPSGYSEGKPLNIL